ncbi:MAG TPA: hypothetical protein VM734_03155 [Kofleriaceae bacterium]|nr:hypothetical protein [Kofleriaceae bacterium]
MRRLALALALLAAPATGCSFEGTEVRAVGDAADNPADVDALTSTPAIDAPAVPVDAPAAIDAATPPGDRECEGRDDCMDGQACCIGFGGTTTCGAASCPVRACGDDDDCRQGETCCNVLGVDTCTLICL